MFVRVASMGPHVVDQVRVYDKHLSLRASIHLLCYSMCVAARDIRRSAEDHVVMWLACKSKGYV